MVTEVQNHNIIFCQAITDTRHRVIGRLNINLRCLELIRTLHHQGEHVWAMLVKTFDRNLESIVQLFHKDLDFRCHSRSDVVWRIDDLDDRRILLYR